eukprot:51823-Rhodomonas_salina.2
MPRQAQAAGTDARVWRDGWQRWDRVRSALQLPQRRSHDFIRCLSVSMFCGCSAIMLDLKLCGSGRVNTANHLERVSKSESLTLSGSEP